MNRELKHIYEFGPYRLDVAERLLLREDETVPLTPKAFDLLLVLLEHHGHLLEKDELLKLVWPDSFVEENNLADNISKLRRALGESGNGQHYIETVPKRGYRFVASVREVEREGLNGQEPLGSQGPTEEGGRAAESQQVATARTASKAEDLIIWINRHQRSALLALALLTVAAAALAYFGLRLPPPPKVWHSTEVTRDGHQKIYSAKLNSSLVTDGSRLYFLEHVDGQWVLAHVSSMGGETAAIPVPFRSPIVMDLSPSRAELLVARQAAAEHEAPLWAMPVLGGPARRLGDLLGHAAAWSPDGQQIVYANSSALYLSNSDGTASRELVTVDGRPHWPRWSPDGSRLRFTVQDDKTNLPSLWEVAVDGANLHPLLPGWNNPANECCGNWTADGRYYVFQSSRNGATNIWVIREQAGLFRKASPEPVRLTFGPMNFYRPVPSQDGKRLFAVGEQQRGELVRFDAKTQQWVSYLSGMSADCLDFSADGEWIVYTTYPEGHLWRSKVDGRERQQLSFPPMRTFLPRWSPNGKQIAFAAQMPGRPWKIYLVSAEGGSPQPLTQEERWENDPGWSPDGNTLVFGSGSFASGFAVYLLDVNTRQVSLLPGSEGMYSPRWSPDGRYIVTISVGPHYLMLYDFTTQKWMELVKLQSGGPRWSRDGKYIYFSTAPKDGSALFRVRIDDRKIEQLLSLKNLRQAAGWVGWAPDDSPLTLRDVGTEDI